VLVDGGDGPVDITNADAGQLRQMRRECISMVFQQFGLLPWRNVLDNVAFGLELSGMPHAEREEKARAQLELVGLTDWADRKVAELSGGMQQRVGLARAFATEAPILLMDEPFSALDPLIRTRLQDELLELQANLKRTIVFVSHDLDEALKIGTHIAIMEGGRIVQYGEPEEIVLRPANEYVAEFVAHMNPLNVLRGASLMTPLAELARDGGAVRLDGEGRVSVTLDAAGVPTEALINGGPAALVPYDPGAGSRVVDRMASGAAAVVVAPVDLPMRTVIELRQTTGQPVVLVEDGRFAGVCGDAEIYRGILRQSGIADTKTAGAA
jgi:glycine betaine/proline transport system ATP-binding protein